MGTKIRVLLVDDHSVVREGLKRLIETEDGIEVLGEAANGREAVEKAILLQPDIVVMDVSMPELNGVQATQQLKKRCPEIKVLALTLLEEQSYLRELLAAGVSGYALKRAAGDELIRAVRTISAGGTYLDPNVAGKVVSTFVQSPNEDAPQLTQREAAVLRLIAEGYSNKEIGAQLSLSTKTVETYKARSMEKLGLRGRVDIVRYALRCGWLKAND